MKYTLGPWHVEEINGTLEIIPSGHATERRIARALYSGGSEDDEVYGNARLIAAAPDLVAALQKSIQRIEQLANIVNALSPGKVRADDFADVASAALQKAGIL